MIKLDMSIVYTIINLIVLYLLLRHFLIRPVTEVMEKRRRMIEEGFQNAQAAQEDALKMKQEYEASLKGAKQEAVQIVENARRSAKSEYDRIVSQAGGEAENILVSAKETVRMEREKAMQEMKSEIAHLAAASARKLIKEGTREQQDKALYEEFLREKQDEN